MTAIKTVKSSQKLPYSPKSTKTEKINPLGVNINWLIFHHNGNNTKYDVTINWC